MPKKYLYPLIIGLVVIAYMYIGEGALIGLTGLLFGKDNKRKANDIESERDEHEQLEGERLNDAVLANIEADKKHDAAQQKADDITIPNDPPAPGTTRKHFTSK